MAIVSIYSPRTVAVTANQRSRTYISLTSFGSNLGATEYLAVLPRIYASLTEDLRIMTVTSQRLNG